ncbi:MAG: DUF3467 domain-containing protein [Paludibacteraceae bacterium]|nr:DUF3467 domain-containing protein [Paludibacteraceae bacterium]
MEQKENQLNIELPQDVADGVYANLAIIAHSPSEFILDFVRVVPNAPKAKVKSRIIMTPEHAKRLLNALQDNIGKYEQQYGQIKFPERSVSFPMGFGGGKA